MRFDPGDADAGVKGEVEDSLLGIEKLIASNNGSKVGKWCREQRRDLERSAEIDSKALALQQAATQNCVENIGEEVDRQTQERSKAATAASKYRADREKDFLEDLRQVGESHAEATAKVVCEYTSKVRAIGEVWDANAWDRLDKQLGAISWQQARMLHASNPTAGVADVYTSGVLTEYLAAEKEGWARSQQNDLDRLTADIQAEADQVFANLQTRLRKMAPEAILVKPWIERLSEMVAAEKDRLKVLEREATSAYESEIDAATWQCSEDYHGYDSELQRILVRALEERCTSLSEGRSLKLSLCRWRLDYQVLYSKNLVQIKLEHSQRRGSNANFGQAKETAPRRFMMVRRLMRRLWTHGKVPQKEIHAFLKKVQDSALRHGVGFEFEAAYRKEIEKHGATPLIAQAANPAVLDLWMEAYYLHRKNKDGDDDELDMSQKAVAKRGTGFIS
jgi:hypothetical protein